MRAARKQMTACRNVKSHSGKQMVAHASSVKKLVEKTATMFLDKTKKPIAAMSKKNKKQNVKHLKVAAAKSLPKAPSPTNPEEKKAVIEEIVQQEEHLLKKENPQEAVHENNNEVAQAENSKEELVRDEVAAACDSSVAESFDIAIGAGAPFDGQGDEQEFPGLSPEAARIYYAVQEEIMTRWRPPMGLPKDLVCTISVRLDRQGGIVNTTVKKPSGVLIYDLAANQAAQEMKLPQIAWGKEFSIAFKL